MNRTVRRMNPRQAGRGALGLAAGALLLCSCSKPPTAGPPPAASQETPVKTEKNVIVSALAGSWYTDDVAELKRDIDGYLAAAGPSNELENVHALLLPHAGYRYSGAVAGFGVRQVQGRKFSRVIVLGPSHRVSMPNAIALPDGTHYRTLLGEIPLDTSFLHKLKDYPIFRKVRGAMPGEHSVEIEFPLLQQALGDFTLVPLVCGQLDDHAVHEAAAALRAEMDPDTLLVVSSDFTHYGPRFDYQPFTTNLEENLRKLDLGAFGFVEQKDCRGFRTYVRDTGATICGHDPIAILTAMLPPESKVKLLKYDTSGHLTGDWENSVSYLCAAVSVTWTPQPSEAARRKSSVKEEADTGGPLDIPAADRQALLGLARKTIQFYFDTKGKATPKDVGVTVTPAMRQTAGAFVTLTKHGELRGCIGEIVPARALIEAVSDHALNAAFKDPRFPRLDPKELADCDIEISALAPPSEVSSYKDIEIGRHGIVLHKGGHGAVFLPQVAPEQGWDLPTTLSYLSMKAGLPADGWKEGATFAVFEATVFGEKKRR